MTAEPGPGPDPAAESDEHVAYRMPDPGPVAILEEIIISVLRFMFGFVVMTFRVLFTPSRTFRRIEKETNGAMLSQVLPYSYLAVSVFGVAQLMRPELGEMLANLIKGTPPEIDLGALADQVATFSFERFLFSVLPVTALVIAIGFLSGLIAGYDPRRRLGTARVMAYTVGAALMGIVGLVYLMVFAALLLVPGSAGEMTSSYGAVLGMVFGIPMLVPFMAPILMIRHWFMGTERGEKRSRRERLAAGFAAYFMLAAIAAAFVPYLEEFGRTVKRDRAATIRATPAAVVTRVRFGTPDDESEVTVDVLVTNTTSERFAVLGDGTVTIQWRPDDPEIKVWPRITAPLRVAHPDGATATMLEPGAAEVFVCVGTGKGQPTDTTEGYTQGATIALAAAAIDESGVPHPVEMKGFTSEITALDLSRLRRVVPPRGHPDEPVRSGGD